MNRYEFSVNSYDKLKEFLKVVEDTKSTKFQDTNTAKAEKWKKILPVDTELLRKLKEHNSVSDEVIVLNDEENEDICLEKETNSQSVKQTIEKDMEEMNIQVKDGKNNMQEECLDSYILQSKELLINKEYDAIILMLASCTQSQVDIVFETIKTESNVITFGKFIAQSNNSIAIKSYCDIILIEQVSNGSLEISEILDDFFIKHAEIIIPAFVKCLILVPEKTKISRECINSLKQLSEEHKNQMLSLFIQQINIVYVSHLSIIDNLLHSKMDLLLTKNLLNLLSKNSINLTSHKQFGLLLQSIIQNSTKYLYPLAEHMKSLINMVQDVFKIKLLKMLQKFEEENKCNSFSYTMIFE